MDTFTNSFSQGCLLYFRQLLSLYLECPPIKIKSNRAWSDLQNKNRANWHDGISTQLPKDSLNEKQINMLKKQKLYLENGQLMPQIRLHDLRHLHASMLIKANRTPFEVAERLRHTYPSFALNTYVHLFREQREEEPISIIDFIPESEDNE